MATQSAPSSAEIKARLDAVIRYLYAVAGPDDPMLQALVRRLHAMPGTVQHGTEGQLSGELILNRVESYTAGNIGAR